MSDKPKQHDMKYWDYNEVSEYVFEKLGHDYDPQDFWSEYICKWHEPRSGSTCTVFFDMADEDDEKTWVVCEAFMELIDDAQAEFMFSW